MKEEHVLGIFSFRLIKAFTAAPYCRQEPSTWPSRCKSLHCHIPSQKPSHTLLLISLIQGSLHLYALSTLCVFIWWIWKKKQVPILLQACIVLKIGLSSSLAVCFSDYSIPDLHKRLVQGLLSGGQALDPVLVVGHWVLMVINLWTDTNGNTETLWNTGSPRTKRFKPHGFLKCMSPLPSLPSCNRDLHPLHRHRSKRWMLRLPEEYHASTKREHHVGYRQPLDIRR